VLVDDNFSRLPLALMLSIVKLPGMASSTQVTVRPHDDISNQLGIVPQSWLVWVMLSELVSGWYSRVRTGPATSEGAL
jgi:hypothetical protein